MYRILYLPTQEFLFINNVGAGNLIDPLFARTPYGKSLIQKQILKIAEFKNLFLAEKILLKSMKKWKKFPQDKLFKSNYPNLVRKYPLEDIKEINFYTILWIDHV